MTKSKITLFTSPTQKLVIYLDPEKNKKEECYCKPEKFHKSLSTATFITESTSYNSVSESRVSDVYPSLEISTEHLLRDIETRNHRESDISDEAQAKDLQIRAEESNDVYSPILIDDEIFKNDEILPLNLIDDQAPIDDEILKPHDLKKPELSNKSVLSTENISFEKEFQELNQTNLNAETENRKQTNKAVIDEQFIKAIANIVEISNLGVRKNKLDELLKNLSTTQIGGLLKSATSVPFFNQSFYRYRAKSRLEGLTFTPHKIYNYGEKGSGFQSQSGSQDFYALRHQCIAKGKLFEDPEFLPTDSSLFYSHKPGKTFRWKRPKEIVKNPQLFVEGASRFDVLQGDLGDCWLLAAVANLTLYKRLFSQIVPDDQSFEKDYAGIFHFRFWQYGRWVDVTIDDRLPTYNRKLLFLHSSESNEFWSALLEKAYAKLHGSYEALKGGCTFEAMEDLTGGVTETYEWKKASPNLNEPANLFKIILKAYERWSLMSCSIDANPEIVGAQTPEGLIKGHAYGITKVQYLDITTPKESQEKIPMLRLRNPWGNESEWKGAWSDNSQEWEKISDKQKKELGLIFKPDGEFWMSFNDFQKHFDSLDICNLNPDSLSDDELKEGRNKKWVMSVFEGEWVRGVTAGGCRNFLSTFHHNPQYRVTLTEEDEGDEEKKCTLIVALMQKNRRQVRRSGGVDLLTIGFAIYHLRNPERLPKPLSLSFFKYNASLTRSPKFINLREISWRFKLSKGTYCIVPSTFDPNEEGEFLLRVFSEHQNNMEENDQQIGHGDAVIEPLSPNEVRENELILQLFKNVAGKDEEVDWKELQEILDYYTKKETRGFSKDVCRSMIAMLDTDRNGKLNFDEFKRLWTSIRIWKNVFLKFDRNQSRKLTGFELREALTSAGYTLNNHILNILMHRYGNKDGDIEFDDFIMCAVKLKVMMELFKDVASPQSNNATFCLEDWIEYTLYT